MGRSWGTHTPEPRRVGACAPTLKEAPTSAPGPTRGAKLACPCPAQLGLSGSSCCDSEWEWLAPNWFERRGEPALSAGVGDTVWSQAWPPHYHSGTSGKREAPLRTYSAPPPPPGSQSATPPRLCPLSQGFWPGPRPVSPKVSRARAREEAWRLFRGWPTTFPQTQGKGPLFSNPHAPSLSCGVLHRRSGAKRMASPSNKLDLVLSRDPLKDAAPSHAAS